MLKIYNTKHEFVCLIDKCKDCRVTEELETGFKTLSFQLPVTKEYLSNIAEEYYVETADYSYVVKEINLKTNDFLTAYCNPNLEELKSLVSVFDAFAINIEQAITKALTFTKSTWKLQFNSKNNSSVEYKLSQTSVKEILDLIKEDFDLEIFYDTKNKIVKVYDHMGEEKGVYFSNELQLQMLSRQGQSYDFATIIYPIGKDGITIGKINNGIETITNHSYCEKNIPLYWRQDDIEHAEQLKMAATAYLDYISAPVVSYSLELSALTQDVSLGDSILIIDKIKKIKQKQRIIKIIHYPFSPEKDKIELSNEIINFAKLFTKYNSNYEKQIEFIKKNLATLN